MFPITCFIFCKWWDWNHITWISSWGKFISETGEKEAERILLSAHLPSQGLSPKCREEKKGITLNVQNNKRKSKSCLLNFKGLISNNLKEKIFSPPGWIWLHTFSFNLLHWVKNLTLASDAVHCSAEFLRSLLKGCFSDFCSQEWNVIFTP